LDGGRQAGTDGGRQGDPQHCPWVIFDERGKELLAIGSDGEHSVKKLSLFRGAGPVKTGILRDEALGEIFRRVHSREGRVMRVGEPHSEDERHAGDKKTSGEKSRA